MRNKPSRQKRVTEQATVPWFIERSPAAPEDALLLIGDWQAFCTASLQGGKSPSDACAAADKLMVELLDRQRLLQDGVPELAEGEPETDGSVAAEVVSNGNAAAQS